MNDCVCCGIEIIGDGTEAGDGFYCNDCRSHRNFGFGECDCVEEKDGSVP